MAEPTTRLSRLRFGVFEVDLRAGELRKDGLKTRLPEQSFQILALLLEHPGGGATREELLEGIWGSDTFVDFEHDLATPVKKLHELSPEQRDES